MDVFMVDEAGKCVVTDFGKSPYNKNVWKDASVLLKKDGGGYYTFYLPTPEPNGVFYPDIEKETYNLKLEFAKLCVDATLKLIQSKIDEYNLTNGMTIESIHTLKTYADDPNYRHKAFADKIIPWAVSVWDAADQIKVDVLAGVIPQPSSVDEYLSMLPPYPEV